MSIENCEEGAIHFQSQATTGKAPWYKYPWYYPELYWAKLITQAKFKISLSIAYIIPAVIFSPLLILAVVTGFALAGVLSILFCVTVKPFVFIFSEDDTAKGAQREERKLHSDEANSSHGYDANPLPAEETQPLILGTIEDSKEPVITSSHLFDIKTRMNQSEMVKEILGQYKANSVLTRSILSGGNMTCPQSFESHIWFDLDQLQRQKMLHGKPYRSEEVYDELARPYMLAYAEIESLKGECRGLFSLIYEVESISQAFIEKSSDPEMQEIIQSIKSKINIQSFPTVYQWLGDWVFSEYHYVTSGQAEKDKNPGHGYCMRGRHYTPGHDQLYRQQITQTLETEKPHRIEAIKQKYRISHSSCNEVIERLAGLKREQKNRRIDMSSKDIAEKTIQSYIRYRKSKNELHHLLKFFYPQHSRTNSVTAQLQETGYLYYSGYKIERCPESVSKVVFPQVMDEQNIFRNENRVEGQKKVISTPSSWSYNFFDVPTGLFTGRNGEIVFALIGIESQLAIPYRHHEDMASTHLLFKSPGLHCATQKEVYDKKVRQRETALAGDWSADRWFDKKTKLSGHTESLVYGLPSAIIIKFDYEDVAIEARKRYSDAGLMPCDAPFFTFDPTAEQALTHISDEEVYERAKALNSSVRSRKVYDCTSKLDSQAIKTTEKSRHTFFHVKKEEQHGNVLVDYGLVS